MRTNRAPSYGSSHPLRRPVVSTIRELDENSEDNVELTAEGDYLLRIPGDVVDSGRLQGEASGPPPPRRLSDTSDSAPINGASLSPVKHSTGRSFERLIESLFVHAQIQMYLPDFSAVDFHPVTGYDCRAPEIIEALIKARKLDPEQARKAFAVWFVNETQALDVQLKPRHNPFVIQKYWRYFLRRYAAPNSVGNGVPLVFIRRSLWFSVEAEKRLTDSRILLLLFEEARSIFLNGRYLLSRDDVISLGSLLIHKDHGRYSTNPQHLDAVRKNLPQYFPDGLIPTQRKRFRKVHAEDVINEILTVYQGIATRNNDETRLRFLLICRSNPLYGAAFFPGVLEAPPKSRISGMLTGFADTPITVAVNGRGFFVVAATKKDNFRPDVILALSHKEISVTFQEPAEEDALNDSDMACLRVSVVVPMQGDHHAVGVQRSVRIYSKQAPLMAACLSTFIHNEKASEFRIREKIIDGMDTSEQISAVPDIVLSDSTTFVPDQESRKITVKTVKSLTFPDIANRFDRFHLHLPTDP